MKASKSIMSDEDRRTGGMSEHPCKGLGKAATEAFERICIGDALPQMSKGTAAKLLAKGLIERAADKQLSDKLGKFSIPQYFVPLPVHMDWCDWCAEQDVPEDALQ